MGNLSRKAPLHTSHDVALESGFSPPAVSQPGFALDADEHSITQLKQKKRRAGSSLA